MRIPTKTGRTPGLENSVRMALPQIKKDAVCGEFDKQECMNLSILFDA